MFDLILLLKDVNYSPIYLLVFLIKRISRIECQAQLVLTMNYYIFLNSLKMVLEFGMILSIFNEHTNRSERKTLLLLKQEVFNIYWYS